MSQQKIIESVGLNPNGSVPSYVTNKVTAGSTIKSAIDQLGAAIGTSVLPSQTGQAGKFLGTDGTNTSWSAVSGGGSSGQTVTSRLALTGSNQTVTTGVWTKIALNTTSFDSSGIANPTTNRITPNVAGYYNITGSFYVTATSGMTYTTVGVYKNGALNSYHQATANTGVNGGALVNDVVYMNGTTDYLEVWGIANGVSPTIVATPSITFLECSLLQQVSSPTTIAASAYRTGAQAITSGAWNKIQLNTENFDTNSAFDTATNYRFTAPVSGYYQYVGKVIFAAASGMTQLSAMVKKNGLEDGIGSYTSPASATAGAANCSGSVYLNAGDYLELYGFVIATTPTIDLTALQNTRLDVMLIGGNASQTQAPVTFKANLSTDQTGITSASWIKVNLNSTAFDTSSAFNTSTSKFQPTTAGYYQLEARLQTAAVSGLTGVRVSLYKNGVGDTYGANTTPDISTNGATVVSGIIYLNGTTDYVELYGYTTGTTLSFSQNTYLTGHLISSVAAPAQVAFKATLSATQAAASSTWVKVNLNTREFDTNNYFDTTNSRFQPTVAGYYSITYSTFYSGGTGFSNQASAIWKNGASFAQSQSSTMSGTHIQNGTAVVYLNGTTDYLELYSYIVGTSPVLGTPSQVTFLSGFLISSSSKLDDLSDVVITNPTSNQVVKFNGSQWVNSDSGVLGQNTPSSAVAFRAALTTPTALTSGTWTKVNFDTKVFDTSSFFDTANKRFQPTIAGYYQINATAAVSGTGIVNFLIALYKNGAVEIAGNYNGPAGSTTEDAVVAGIVYLNGSTDYLEVYAVFGGTTGSVAYNLTANTFSGHLVNAISAPSTIAASAYRTGTDQAVTSATWTKVQLNGKSFDTNNAFDNGTSSRFTAPQAGYYQINGKVALGGTTVTQGSSAIWKNGATAAAGLYHVTSGGNSSSVVSKCVYLAAGDYVELAGYVVAAASPTFMSGSGVDTTFDVTYVGGNAAQTQTPVTFKAYNSATQTIPTATNTKVNINTASFDTAGSVDTTNGKIIPKTAGYYQITASTWFSGGSTFQAQAAMVFKNGSVTLYSVPTQATSGGSSIVSTTGIVYLNGTTDYLELYAYIQATSPILGSNENYTFIEGHLISAVATPSQVAFRVQNSASAQSVTSGAWTKVNLTVKGFDTNNFFDATTNSRFQPLIAGYYFLTGAINGAGTGLNAVVSALYKNGTIYKQGNTSTTGGAATVFTVDDVVYMNGSTDYIELYGIVGATSAAVFSASACVLSGFLISAAPNALLATTSAVGGVKIGNGLNIALDGTLSNAASSPNILVNGGMRVDQERGGAAHTPTTYQMTYALDQWQAVTSQASKLTFQRNAGAVTPPPGFSNYLGVTVAAAFTPTATDQFIVTQPVVGAAITDLAYGTASAKTSTVSFWVRSSLTGTFTGSVNAVVAPYCSYPFPFTINSANTWEFKTVVVSGATIGAWTTSGVTGGANITFNLGTGTNFQATANTWTVGDFKSVSGAVNLVANAGATLYITGVKWEVGSTATPFVHDDPQVEISRCQYFFQPLFLQNTDDQWGISSPSATTAGLSTIRIPEMRVTPTLQLGGASPYGRVVAYDTTGALSTGNSSGMSVNSAASSPRSVSINTTHASVALSYVYRQFDTWGSSGTHFLTARL